MSTTDKQSQDLNQIAGVQDLNNENAAAVSGGVALLGNCFDFKGRQRKLSAKPGQGFKSLGFFNNKASSIGITPGEEWSFWTGKNFKAGGDTTAVSITLGAGIYNLNEFPFDLFNNDIESVKRIR